MDFAQAFTFPFQDKEWIKKIVITALISFIPILGGIAVLGWSLEVGRRLIRGEAPVLPDWSNFGGLLSLGIKGFVVSLVLSIPLIVLYLPASLLSAFADSEQMATLLSIVSICTSCLGLLYVIAFMFVLPAAYGQLAATDSLGEAFNVGKLWSLIRNAPVAYLIVILGLLVAGIIAPLGVIACFIGVFFTLAYTLAVQGHLYGQAYREGTKAPAA